MSLAKVEESGEEREIVWREWRAVEGIDHEIKLRKLLQ